MNRKYKRLAHFLLCCFLPVIVTGSMCLCRQGIVDSVPFFYTNSFEIRSDTTGWTGITSSMFIEDPAPGEGTSSLRIGGGCMQPAASITFPHLHRSERFRLSLWGKAHDQNQTGTIALTSYDGKSNLDEITIHIDDPRWRSYRTEASLICVSGTRLRMEIRIGGFVPATMQIDGLIIERIE